MKRAKRRCAAFTDASHFGASSCRQPAGIRRQSGTPRLSPIENGLRELAMSSHHRPLSGRIIAKCRTSRRRSPREACAHGGINHRLRGPVPCRQHFHHFIEVIAVGAWWRARAERRPAVEDDGGSAFIGTPRALHRRRPSSASAAPAPSSFLAFVVAETALSASADKCSPARIKHRESPSSRHEKPENIIILSVNTYASRRAASRVRVKHRNSGAAVLGGLNIGRVARRRQVFARGHRSRSISAGRHVSDGSSAFAGARRWPGIAAGIASVRREYYREAA